MKSLAHVRVRRRKGAKPRRPRFERDTDTHLFRLNKRLRVAVAARQYGAALVLSEKTSEALQQLCKAVRRRDREG